MCVHGVCGRAACEVARDACLGEAALMRSGIQPSHIFLAVGISASDSGGLVTMVVVVEWWW